MTEKKAPRRKKGPQAITYLMEPKAKEEALPWPQLFTKSIKALAQRFESPIPSSMSSENAVLDWLNGFDVNEQQEVLGRMNDILPILVNLGSNPEALFAKEGIYATCSTHLHEETITIRSLENGKNVSLGQASTPTAVAKFHTYRERLPLKDQKGQLPVTGLQVQVKDLAPEHVVSLDAIRVTAQELASGQIDEIHRRKLEKMRKTIDSYPIAQLILTINRTTYDPTAVNPQADNGKGAVHRDPLFSISFKRVPNDQFENGDHDVIQLELKNIQSTKDKNPHKTVIVPIETLLPKIGTTPISLEQYETFLTRVYDDIATYSKTGVISRKNFPTPKPAK
jgi:hypothetical protein